MKKSELKELIKEIIQEERKRLDEMEDMTKGAIAGLITGIALAALGKQSMPPISVDDDPKVKQKKQEFEEATRDFAESLQEYPGRNIVQKYALYKKDLSKIRFDKPIPIFSKKKKSKI